MHIEPGAQARASFRVSELDTASALGTGDVAVLATSRALAFCERSTFEALRATTEAGSTSVAMRVNFDHIRAVSVGCEVTALATLERVEGRRYVFVVSLLDAGGEVVASGRIVRVVVNTDDFLDRACGNA